GAGFVVGGVAGVLVRRERLDEDEGQHERDEDPHRGQQVGERDALGGVVAPGRYAFRETALPQQPERTRQHHDDDDERRHLATVPPSRAPGAGGHHRSSPAPTSGSWPLRAGRDVRAQLTDASAVSFLALLLHFLLLRLEVLEQAVTGRGIVVILLR